MTTRYLLLGMTLTIAATTSALAAPWPTTDVTMTTTGPVVVTYRAVRAVTMGPPADYGALKGLEDIVNVEGMTTAPHRATFNGTFFNIPNPSQSAFRTMVRALSFSPGCLDLIATTKAGYWTAKRITNLDPPLTDRALVIEIPIGSTVQFTSTANGPSVQVVSIATGSEVKCSSHSN